MFKTPVHYRGGATAGAGVEADEVGNGSNPMDRRERADRQATLRARLRVVVGDKP
jgi:hypothetical protein